MEEETKEKRSAWNRGIRIFLRVFAFVFLIVVFLLIAINIPLVQTFIAGKFIKSIREKTGTEISLRSVKIALPNSVKITDLFLTDKDADTLLYLHSLSIDVSLFGLLRNEVAIKSLSLENVVANIQRPNPEEPFNFRFLLDVFAPEVPVKPDTAIKKRKPWLIKVNDVSLQHIRACFFDAR